MIEIFLFCGIIPILIFSKTLVWCVLYVLKYCVEGNQNQQKRNNSTIQGYVAFLRQLSLTFLHYLTDFQFIFDLKIIFKGYKLALFFIWGQIKEVKRKKKP